MIKTRFTSNLAIKEILILIITILFFGGQYLQLNVGWADNHDFRRVNQLFTDKPAGFEVDSPETNTPEYELRYTNYWLPVWNFKWGIPSLYSAFSSTILLWIPGAVLNLLFISSSSLYMVALSFFPRLLIWLCLVWLLISFYNNIKEMLVWSLLFVVPLIFMMSTSDYAAYFNSFYQDIGSLVYLMLLITYLIIKHHFQSNWSQFLGFALLLLLTTAKSSNFYFPFLFMPLIFDFRQIFRKPVIAIFLIVIGLATSMFTIKFVGDRSNANLYHSLFLGVLVSSEYPEQRLLEIGINDPNVAAECRVSVYTRKGANCLKEYNDYLSYINIIKIIVKEPKILYYHAKRVAKQMHRINIGLGQFTADNKDQDSAKLLNTWSILKRAYFPNGWTLYAFLSAEFIFIAVLRNKYKLLDSLANLAQVLLVACFIDMFVAILGDGVADIVKHLFMANILFDVSFILTCTLLVLSLVLVKID